MQFEYHYFGRSSATSTASRTGLSFAPDALRAPTFFDGRVSHKLPFREAVSALHDVVVSDLRFRPKDRTEYLQWRARQDEIDWVELSRLRKDVQARIEATRAELETLRQRSHQRRAEFYRAQQRYFDYLYRRDYDAWFVLDPVITVHPDEISFECFSQDESSYGRLACSYEIFTELGQRACGTTNVDYSAALYDEFQKIREYKETALTVDPTGFDVKTTGEAAYREVKIDLPPSWVRGLLQVSAAMTRPAVSVSLHPMDVHNLCFLLRRNKERHGPRSMRFLLEPGAPVRVRMEPWNIDVVCPRSIFEGDQADEIRVWGRRRLLVLERLLPVARRITVRLAGSGMPSIWLADLGDMTFTLGLSGWTSNDWSAHANFDLLAPRTSVDAVTARRVFEALKERWRATPPELSEALQLDPALVTGALGLYTQAGRVMYDVGQQVYRARELSREPLPLDTLRFSSEREAQALRLVDAGQLRDVELGTDTEGRARVVARIEGGRRPVITALVLDADDGVAGAECSCDYFVRNRLRRGPCEHILALRVVAHRMMRGHA